MCYCFPFKKMYIDTMNITKRATVKQIFRKPPVVTLVLFPPYKPSRPPCSKWYLISCNSALSL